MIAPKTYRIIHNGELWDELLTDRAEIRRSVAHAGVHYGAPPYFIDADGSDVRVAPPADGNLAGEWDVMVDDSRGNAVVDVTIVVEEYEP